MNRICDDCNEPLDGAPLPPEVQWLCGKCAMREIDAGDSYDRQATLAHRLSEALRQAKADGADPAKIRRLERQLEQARYTGD